MSAKQFASQFGGSHGMSGRTAAILQGGAAAQPQFSSSWWLLQVRKIYSATTTPHWSCASPALTKGRWPWTSARGRCCAPGGSFGSTWPRQRKCFNLNSATSSSNQLFQIQLSGQHLCLAWQYYGYNLKKISVMTPRKCQEFLKGTVVIQRLEMQYLSKRRAVGQQITSLRPKCRMIERAPITFPSSWQPASS